MKRNSTTLYLQSPGATTPIPWIDNAPDFSSFTEPTLSVLQKSWNDFVDSGEELEIIPDPEPVAEQVYDPAQFLQQMFANAAFETWLSNFSTFKQAGLLDACTNAKVDNNWTVVQAIYDQYKAAVAPATADVAAWQIIADDCGVPLSF